MKKSALVFILAFILNWVWEIAHSVLYVNYKGGSITPLILFKAALVDAGIILILVFVAQKCKLNKTFVVVVGGLIVAIAVEIWALQTGRWVYSLLMPKIPIIKVGLTPTIQLAITGYISYKICKRCGGSL